MHRPLALLHHLLHHRFRLLLRPRILRAVGTLRRVFLLSAAGGLLLSGPGALAQDFDETPAEIALPTAVAARPENVIRIGLLNFESEVSYSNTRDMVQKSVVGYLRRHFPRYEIEAHYYTTPALIEAIKQGRVEFFLASSGFFVSMRQYGVRDVGTLVSPLFPQRPRESLHARLDLRLAGGEHAPCKLHDLSDQHGGNCTAGLQPGSVFLFH